MEYAFLGWTGLRVSEPYPYELLARNTSGRERPPAR